MSQSDDKRVPEGTTPEIAPGMKELIARLQQDGIQAGERRKEEIIANAKQEAARIVEDARKEAEAIVAKARSSSKQLQESGEEALRLATRDTVLRLRDRLTGSLSSLTRALVATQLEDEEFLRQLIVEIARRASDESNLSEGGEVEVLLPDTGRNDDDANLAEFAREVMAKAWREGVSIDELGPGAHGLRLRLKGEDLDVDLTDAAVTDILLHHLQPRFRALLEGLLEE